MDTRQTARAREVLHETATHWQPLHEAPDPRGYIPRHEMEHALRALRCALAAGASRLAVVGAPGLGKTLLLRLLEEHADRELRTLYIPFASLEPDDLARWALALEGKAAAGAPEAEFLSDVAARYRDRDQRTLLLVDEAQTLGDDTAKCLSRWVERSRGALAVVLAGIAGAAVEAALRVLDAELRLELRTPIAEAELAAFADALVSDLALPTPRRIAVERMLEGDLWIRTGGNPRLVKGEILRVLRAPLATGAPAVPATPQREETVDSRGRESARGSLRSPHFPEPCGSWSWCWLFGALVLVVVVAFGVAGRGRDLATEVTEDRGAPTAEVARSVAVQELPPSSGPQSSGSRLVPPAHGDPLRSPFAPPREFVSSLALSERVTVAVNAVPWARVRVDGVEVGVTPIGILRLTAGRHRFAAEFPDGRLVEREIEVREGLRVVFP